MKKLLLGLGVVSIATLPLLAVVSCSSENPTSANITVKEFVSKQSNTSKVDEGFTNVLDPNININAQKILRDEFLKLTKEQLQADFDKVLSKFYDAYEIETESQEIEIESITVKELGEMAEGANTRVAKLLVKYSVETETKKDNEVLLSKEIEWILKPSISSSSEIEAFKQSLISEKPSSSNGNVDLEDLKEYFLGEKDDDDDNDLGIFDKLAKITKGQNGVGGMVGYTIKPNEILNAIMSSSKAITGDTEFFVPSFILNNIFLKPSVPPKLDYTFNETELKKITKEELLKFTNPIDLEKILISTSNVYTDVKNISIEELGPLLKITISFNDNMIPEAISLNPSLLKPATPPAV